MPLKDIKSLPNGGRVGTMPDGSRVIVRPNSSDGRPTLEVQNSNGNPVSKTRYGTDKPAE